jgi:hypothetical protein
MQSAGMFRPFKYKRNELGSIQKVYVLIRANADSEIETVQANRKIQGVVEA